MKKINIAELLKDCPKGMKLDCTMFESLEFDSIVDNSFPPIRCRILNPDGNGYNIYDFTKHGCWNTFESAKCVIFPKGKTTWEGFQKPFKNGDVVAFDNPYRENLQLFIFKDKEEGNTCSNCYLMLDGNELDLEEGMYYVTRLATEEEKEKLFKAIKDNGYKWNAETKTLEKLIEPKFKVGDRIKHRLTGDVYKVLFVLSNGYGGGVYDVAVTNEIGKSIDIKEQDSYDLVPNKFDINTLQPFDKMLVRDTEDCFWNIGFFSFKKDEYFMTDKGYFAQCIPFEGNEHLLGTTKDCDEYYKTWK